MSKSTFLILLFVCILPFVACRPVQEASDMEMWGEPIVYQQDSGTDELLIGLDAVNDQVVWAAGTGGAFVRTVDGGTTWYADGVPGADSLQFRDVHAIDQNTAYLLSIGPGDDSRIYRTMDAGESWHQVFVNENEEAFFDCFDFWEDGRGIAFSDAVEDRFPLVGTRDGAMWEPYRGPEAQPGEGGFAASGTCLITVSDDVVLIGTGNADVARVLRSGDGGSSWVAAPTPIVAGEGAGITTLSFRDERHGAVLGGDLEQPQAFTDNVAVTNDGGRTWQRASHPTFRGAVYGSSYVPGAPILVAVGPNGMSYTHDDAQTWSPADTLSYWSVDFVSSSAGWAVGPEGRIARIAFPRPELAFPFPNR